MKILTPDAPPAALAVKAPLDLGGMVPGEELKAKISAFLSELARELEQSGCTLIGHIKGLVTSGERGHLMFSITSFQEKVRFKGNIVQATDSAELTLNVIVYGMETTAVEAVFQSTFDKYFK